MKKYASYILILIILVGLSIPLTIINAQPTPATPATPETPVPKRPPTSSDKPPTQPTVEVPNKTDPNYHFLVPLPCDKNADPNCKSTTIFNPKDPTALGNYLNLMIKIIIGLAAVMAVIMIVIGGMEYMTSELISGKEAGKERIRNALLGLILALGAYALLFTINPDLLKTDFNIPDATVNVTIENFQVTGALSRTGAPVNVNFNTEAYPAAKAAGSATGVDEALVLAIFAQESGSGVNTGACHPNDAGARMTTQDRTALQTILGSGVDINSVNVSCAGAVGNGGAIGLTQFLPTTWIQYQNMAALILNHQPDPWNVNDALMVTALKLRADGGVTNPRQAACAYFGACSSGGVNYADDIMAKMANLKNQIADRIKNGTIQP